MEHKQYDIRINGERLIARLNELGSIGITEEGFSRVAASNEDKLGRDKVVEWMKEEDLRIVIDKIGNVIGIWETEENKHEKPIMSGSHIDTVINAGIYDGCYGVISAIEVLKTLRENNVKTKRPLAVGFFTNEEGSRYQPDMMGSLVYVGDMSAEEALAAVGTDGTIMKEELERIGYYGDSEPGTIIPAGFVEAHIEQGPILDYENYQLGAVENLQGISWQRLTIEGTQNHAGTTPTHLRKDAGLAAARITTYLRDRALATMEDSHKTVTTVGEIAFTPNMINVIPEKVVMTADIRNPNTEKWHAEKAALDEFIKVVEKEENVKISKERLADFEPVTFDENIVKLIEATAEGKGLRYRRMTSGAGHDAQMMARICPTAMIFVPNKDGISHNPKESAKDEDLIAGSNVHLEVIYNMLEQ